MPFRAFRLTWPRLITWFPGQYWLCLRITWDGLNLYNGLTQLFLSSLQRFFSVDRSLYGPADSSVGVPEGCPLAVTCMVAITWFTGNHLEACTGFLMSSFVDNWAVQTDNPASLLSAVQTIVSTTEHIAMVVSKHKLMPLPVKIFGNLCWMASHWKSYMISRIWGFSFALPAGHPQRISLLNSSPISAASRSSSRLHGVTFVRRAACPVWFFLRLCSGLS